jgi:hypothetical protein
MEFGRGLFQHLQNVLEKSSSVLKGSLVYEVMACFQIKWK